MSPDVDITTIQVERLLLRADGTPAAAASIRKMCMKPSPPEAALFQLDPLSHLFFQAEVLF